MTALHGVYIRMQLDSVSACAGRLCPGVLAAAVANFGRVGDTDSAHNSQGPRMAHISRARLLGLKLAWDWVPEGLGPIGHISPWSILVTTSTLLRNAASVKLMELR